MKIKDKNNDGVFTIEISVPADKEYTIDEVQRKLNKIEKQIVNNELLIAERDEWKSILDVMTNYNG